MAEKWLDERALKAIAKELDSDDDDIELVSQGHEDPVRYEEQRLDVELPGGQIQRIEYVAPTLKLGDNDGTGASKPAFKEPERRFDVFEHFQYQWIDIPDPEQA